jgi:lipopolysaccharide transport system ATP-binding protein
VKHYSSGMYVRLAFAVATAVDPDILVVDEALAVGDEAFQRKCYARIEGIKERGGTILFVSHAAQQVVQLCDRAVLLDGGEKLLEGEPKMVVGQYQRLINAGPEQARQLRQDIVDGTFASNSQRVTEANSENILEDPLDEFLDASLRSDSEIIYESHGALIGLPVIRDRSGREVNNLRMGRDYTYTYDVTFEREAFNVGFGMLIKTPTGLELGGATTAFDHDHVMDHVKAGAVVRVAFTFECAFLPGVYFLNAGVLAMSDGEFHYLHRRADVLAMRVIQEESRLPTGMISIKPRPMISVIEP